MLLRDVDVKRVLTSITKSVDRKLFRIVEPDLLAGIRGFWALSAGQTGKPAGQPAERQLKQAKTNRKRLRLVLTVCKI